MPSDTFSSFTPPPQPHPPSPVSSLSETLLSSSTPPLDSQTHSVTHRPAAMKSALALLLLVSLACHSHALKCYTCVAANEDECNQQGSASCPQYADACTTIAGPQTVMKSCTYKAFCEKAYGAYSGAKMECCFGDDCNGPHRSHSHGQHHNSAGAPASSPILLLGVFMLRMALSRL